MSFRTGRPRRFTLTDVRPGPCLCRAEDVLSNGWSTTELLLEAAASVLLASSDRGFTLAELVDEVRAIMTTERIQFQGHTSNPGRYRDDAERIVWGRFGDLHRSGTFKVIGGAA